MRIVHPLPSIPYTPSLSFVLYSLIWPFVPSFNYRIIPLYVFLYIHPVQSYQVYYIPYSYYSYFRIVIHSLLILFYLSFRLYPCYSYLCICLLYTYLFHTLLTFLLLLLLSSSVLGLFVSGFIHPYLLLGILSFPLYSPHPSPLRLSFHYSCLRFHRLRLYRNSIENLYLPLHP